MIRPRGLGLPDRGDAVEVTNRDGSTSEGTVFDTLPVTAREYWFHPSNRQGAEAVDTKTTLAVYWEGECDPNARVIEVALDPGKVYAYPADKVEVPG